MVHQILSEQLKKLNDEIYDLTFGDLPPPGHWNQPGWFGSRAHVLLIAQNPGIMKVPEPWQHNRNQNEYLKRAMASNTGQMIFEGVMKAGLKTSQVIYTNLVKSPTLENRPPTQEEITFYVEILKKQMACLPKFTIRKVVTFGALAKQTLFDGVSYNTQIECGSHYILNYPFSAYCTYHPTYVQYNGNRIEYVNKLANFLKEQQYVQNFSL